MDTRMFFVLVSIYVVVSITHDCRLVPSVSIGGPISSINFSHVQDYFNVQVHYIDIGSVSGRQE